MALVSTRIPEEVQSEIDWYAQKEKIGKTIALRKVLDRGLKEIKLEHSLELYQKGKITLMKAAEIAGISLWEMLDVIRIKKIPMLYTLKDVEEDFKSATGKRA